jgi:hypothetical protein
MIEDYMFTSAEFVEADPKASEVACKRLARLLYVTKKWHKAKKDFNYRVQYEKGSIVKIGSKSFKLTECHITDYGNISVYLEDGDLVLRVSDHWSGGSDVRNCGSIKTCYWTLRQKSHTVKVFKEHRVQCGFCKRSTLLASKI